MSGIKSRLIRITGMVSNLLGISKSRDIYVLAETFASVVEETKNSASRTDIKIMAIISADYDFAVSRLIDASSKEISEDASLAFVEAARDRFERAYYRFNELGHETLLVLPYSAVYIGICHLWFNRLNSANNWFLKGINHFESLENTYREDSDRISARKFQSASVAVGGIAAGGVLTVASAIGLGMLTASGVGLPIGVFLGASIGGAFAKPLGDSAIKRSEEIAYSLSPTEKRIREEAAQAKSEVLKMLEQIKAANASS